MIEIAAATLWVTHIGIFFLGLLVGVRIATEFWGNK
jgi:hypothetical protein